MPFIKQAYSVRLKRLYNWLFVIAIIFLLIPPIVDVGNGYAKATTNCSVLTVMDGDTIKMICKDTGIHNARILGYDTPEKNARCMGEYVKSIRATWALRMTLWSSKTIEIGSTKKDKYGRDLINLIADNKNIDSTMIGKGLARKYAGGRRQSWCE